MVAARYPSAAYRDMARHYETLRDQYIEQRDGLDPGARTYQRDLHYLNHVIQSHQEAADKHHRLAEHAEKSR